MALVGLCDVPLSSRLLTGLCQERSWLPERVVYLFPSNASHHRDNVTPCTPKYGANLAEVAWHYGSASKNAAPYPTLGLPTVDVGGVDDVVVKRALRDLGRVLGYGMHVVVSVREHNSVESGNFSQPLEQVAGYSVSAEGEVFPKRSCELNFWGGVKAFESQLRDVADLYHRAVDFAAQLPDDYFSRSEMREKAQAVSPEFARGFQQGLDDFDSHKNAEWYGVDHHYQRVAPQAPSVAQQLSREVERRSAVLTEKDRLLASSSKNCCRCALL